MTPAQSAATMNARLKTTIGMTAPESGGDRGALELADLVHRRIGVDHARLRPDVAARQVEHPAVDVRTPAALPRVLDDARLAEVVDLLDDVELDHAAKARVLVEIGELVPEVQLGVLQRPQPVVDQAMARLA